MFDDVMRQGMPRERHVPPMGLLEIGFLFGGLAFLIDGLSLVLFYGLHPFFIALQCLIPFVYIGAGFAAARRTAVANGVWAAIVVASLDTLCGLGLYLFLRAADVAQAAETARLLPAGATAFIIPLALVSLVSRVILGGLLWGGIGGKIGQAVAPGPRRR